MKEKCISCWEKLSCSNKLYLLNIEPTSFTVTVKVLVNYITVNSCFTDTPLLPTLAAGQSKRHLIENMKFKLFLFRSYHAETNDGIKTLILYS